MVDEHCMVTMNIVRWMNLHMYDAFWYLLLMYGGSMNYVGWIMVVYIFSFWYLLLMDNGCMYIYIYIFSFWN
jgi:hypothetical protein